jgi:hypothetical protein
MAAKIYPFSCIWTERSKSLPIIKQVASIASVPALLCYQDSIQECAERGMMLFYHGFTCTKETHEEEMNSLVRAGFLVVSLDNVGHGERRYPNFAEIFSDERWAEERLLDIVTCQGASPLSLLLVQIYMLLHPPAGVADADTNWLGADIMTMPVPGAV